MSTFFRNSHSLQPSTRSRASLNRLIKKSWSSVSSTKSLKKSIICCPVIFLFYEKSKIVFNNDPESRPPSSVLFIQKFRVFHRHIHEHKALVPRHHLVDYTPRKVKFPFFPDFRTIAVLTDKVYDSLNVLPSHKVHHMSTSLFRKPVWDHRLKRTPSPDRAK